MQMMEHIFKGLQDAIWSTSVQQAIVFKNVLKHSRYKNTIGSFTDIISAFMMNVVNNYTNRC